MQLQPPCAVPEVHGAAMMLELREAVGSSSPLPMLVVDVPFYLEAVDRWFKANVAGQ